MGAKISVIIKEPGKNPRHVNISRALENLQKTVGGYVESISLSEDLAILCDEDGLLKDKPYCATVCGCDLCGTIVFCGVAENEDGTLEFSDLPLTYGEFKAIFPELWKE